MTNDLSALPQHVRDALERFSDMLSHSAIVNPDNEAADKDALQTIRAELLRLTGENARLRAHNVELAMHAYQWMARHDRINAGEPGGEYPNPTDVPDSIKRAERAESALAELRAKVGSAPLLRVGDPAWGDGTLAEMDGVEVHLVKRNK